MTFEQLCKKTGLTEYTVRLYAEQKLVTLAPPEYTEAEAERLQDIAVLRKCLFTPEEIRLMLLDERRIPLVVAEYAKRMRGQRHLRGLADAAELLDLANIRNVDQLGDALAPAAAGRALPGTDRETSLQFGRLDAESEQEKARLFEAYRAEREKSDRRARRKLYILMVLDALLGLPSIGLFRFFSLWCFKNAVDRDDIHYLFIYRYHQIYGERWGGLRIEFATMHLAWAVIDGMLGVAFGQMYGGAAGDLWSGIAVAAALLTLACGAYAFLDGDIRRYVND